MEWFFLILASFGEIFGVASINLFLKKRSLLWLGAVVVTFAFGFFFLALAMEKIPMATAYAVWTGLGATEALLSCIICFRDPAGILRLIFITFIFSSAVVFKILS